MIWTKYTPPKDSSKPYYCQKKEDGNFFLVWSNKYNCWTVRRYFNDKREVVVYGGFESVSKAMQFAEGIKE